jgi:hypothetical protein
MCKKLMRKNFKIPKALGEPLLPPIPRKKGLQAVAFMQQFAYIASTHLLCHLVPTTPDVSVQLRLHQTNQLSFTLMSRFFASDDL